MLDVHVGVVFRCLFLFRFVIISYVWVCHKLCFDNAVSSQEFIAFAILFDVYY